MEETPKILVGSPTYHGMKYCNEKFLNSLRSIDYGNFDILIVDNSDTDDFFKELKKEKIIIVLKDDSNTVVKYERLVSSRNRIFSYAETNNYDYVLMMDSDVIAPKSILKDLLSCKKDLVSGVYYNYFPSKGNFVWMPVCWVLLTQKEFAEIKNNYNIPEHFTIKDMPRHLTDKEAKSGELFEAVIPSGGCMLISKKVFEKVKYVLEYKDGKRKKSDDISFIEKAKEEGFQPYCFTKVLCDHLVLGKFKKSGEKLIHPLLSEESKGK